MNKLAEPVILVIDYNALSLTATSSTLNCQNYQVLGAGSSEAAFQTCQDISLDLIVCDVALNRENDGYDLIQQLKQIPDVTDVPVVFMSAGQGPDVVSRTTTAGTAYHLKKPFEPQSLFSLIEKALWLPHLVESHINQHINRPHISFKPNSNHTTSNTYLQN